MSMLKEVAYDIEQLYIEGNSPQRIGVTLGIPLSLVYDWLEDTNVEEGEEYSPHGTINS